MNMNICYLTWDDLTKQWATLSEQALNFFNFEIVFDIVICDTESFKDVSYTGIDLLLVNITNGVLLCQKHFIDLEFLISNLKVIIFFFKKPDRVVDNSLIVWHGTLFKPIHGCMELLLPSKWLN